MLSPKTILILSTIESNHEKYHNLFDGFIREFLNNDIFGYLFKGFFILQLWKNEEEEFLANNCYDSENKLERTIVEVLGVSRDYKFFEGWVSSKPLVASSVKQTKVILNTSQEYAKYFSDILKVEITQTHILFALAELNIMIMSHNK